MTRKNLYLGRSTEELEEKAQNVGIDEKSDEKEENNKVYDNKEGKEKEREDERGIPMKSAKVNLKVDAVPRTTNINTRKESKTIPKIEIDNHIKVTYGKNAKNNLETNIVSESIETNITKESDSLGTKESKETEENNFYQHAEDVENGAEVKVNSEDMGEEMTEIDKPIKYTNRFKNDTPVMNAENNSETNTISGTIKASTMEEPEVSKAKNSKEHMKKRKQQKKQ